jgi:hypothetical protein
MIAVIYTCVRGIDFASVFTIFLLDFGAVLTIWYVFFHFNTLVAEKKLCLNIHHITVLAPLFLGIKYFDGVYIVHIFSFTDVHLLCDV